MLDGHYAKRRNVRLWNLENFQENSGGGTNPNYDWGHLGWIIPSGRTLKKMTIMGRTNATDVGDVKLQLVSKVPASPNTWLTGLDGDLEFSTTVLHNDLFHTPSVGDPMTGNLTDLGKRAVGL